MFRRARLLRSVPSSRVDSLFRFVVALFLLVLCASAQGSFSDYTDERRDRSIDRGWMSRKTFDRRCTGVPSEYVATTVLRQR